MRGYEWSYSTTVNLRHLGVNNVVECTQPYRTWAALHVKLTKPEPKFSVLWDLEFTMNPGDWAKLQAYSTMPEPKFSGLWDLVFTMKPEASAKLQAHKY